jgi:hypothetical protein
MAILVNNKNKLYVDDLDDTKTIKFNNLVRSEIDKLQPSIFGSLFSSDVKMNECFYNFSLSDETLYNNLPLEMIYIIKLAKNYFDKAGLKVNEYDGRITFKSCKYLKSPLKISDLDIHIDNEEFEDTNTCIFYTEKSDTLKGGNLDIYLKYTFLQSIGWEKLEPFELKIKSGSVVVFDGNLYHCPQPCGGSGYRNIIIVNLSTKK